MTSFNMPLFIVAAFLLFTLVLGMYFSRKETTFREYAVGNKQFATATLVATVLATYYSGGGLVRNVQYVHKLGLYWIILCVFVNSFSRWLFSRLMLRMGPFMQNLSIAETMGNVYGKYPRMITALVGICCSMVSITMQIIVMAQAINMCIDVDLFNPHIITIFAALILIFYSIFGGVRAVSFTDIFQFVTFAIIIPFLTWFMFKKADRSVVEVVSFLQTQQKFQFSSLCHFDTKLVGMFAMALCIMVPDMGAPAIMQRVYMSSGPIQAKKVFLYVCFLGFFITSFILLVGLFVFVGGGVGLPTEDVWHYIMNNIPSTFKGMICISLLAMAMSTADSCLNSCSVIVSHDIFESIQKEKKITDARQLKIARWATLVLGLSSMFLAFYCKDLLELLMLSFAFSLPVVAAPSLLAIFGFRGTSRTALIGMTTGAISILAWNKWIKSTTGIDGAFVCMLANGLAMMAAHYLLKQPEDAGWVKPDHAFIQMQQAHARKKRARKEAIKNALLHIKDTFVQLQPSHTKLISIGFYLFISNLLTYFIASIRDHDYWLMPQLLVGACFLGYGTFVSEKVKSIPGWLVGLFWVMGLSFCLPINLLWHWWHGTSLFLTLGLSLTHLAVTLLVFPLYLGVSFLMATLLMAIYLSSIYCAKPLVLVLSPSGVAFLLLLCLGLGLLIFGLFVYLKAKNKRCFDQLIYLKDREKLNASRMLKASLYDALWFPLLVTESKGNGATLAQVVGKIEESISFLDSNMPLYKQDFQSIIHKLYDWVTFFNRRDKTKNHALLQPTRITLDKLMGKVEFALFQEVPDPPRLLVETISDASGGPSPYIICDINQVIYLLVQAVLRVGKLEGSSVPMVKIQLHNTALQFKQADPIDRNAPSFMLFQATALVVSQATVAPESLPNVKHLYDDTIDAIGPQGQKGALLSIDLQQETLSTIVGAHYGYLAYPVGAMKKAMLLVLPSDVTAIRDKMTMKLPIDCLTVETPITPKEQADSMMALMQFYDHLCPFTYKADPIDVAIISGLLLLLRQHFGFKRHASGALFYVRAVRIAELMVEWVFHSPKVIYAALLYELVRHTCLPLSYVKAHYNLGVYVFVLNVVSIDKRQDLDHPSLLYVQNRLKEAIKEDHVQLSVLFIKLAERLYDLRHAADYLHLSEVAHMAQETLAIDVKIAHAYLDPAIAAALEKAAKEALEVYKSKDKQQRKEKDS